MRVSSLRSTDEEFFLRKRSRGQGKGEGKGDGRRGQEEGGGETEVIRTSRGDFTRYVLFKTTDIAFEK